MAFQPCPNTALFEWIYQTPTGVQENTYHIEGVSPWSEEGLEATALVLYDWWASEMAANCSNTVTLLRVEGKSLEAESAPVAIYYPETLVAGSVVAQSASGNVTFAVKHTTGLTGRANRGRWYIVGLPLDVGGNSSISLALASAFVNAFDNLDAGIAESMIRPVVVHRQVDNVPLTVCTTTEITGHSFTDLNMDSQRRRLRGRGS